LERLQIAWMLRVSGWERVPLHTGRLLDLRERPHDGVGVQGTVLGGDHDPAQWPRRADPVDTLEMRQPRADRCGDTAIRLIEPSYLYVRTPVPNPNPAVLSPPSRRAVTDRQLIL